MCYPRSSILLSYTDINESSTRELLFASAFVIRRLDLFGWYIKQSTKSAKTASLPIPFPQYLTSYNRKDDLDLPGTPLINTYPQIPPSQLESHLKVLSHSVTLHLRHYHNLVQSHSTQLHNLNILSSSIPALFQPLLSIIDTFQDSLDREFDAAKKIPTFEELKLLSNPESIKESFVKIQSEKEIITMNRKVKELEKVWWLWMTSVLEDTPCQEVDIELGENDATSLLTELHEYLTLQSQHLKAQLESLLPTSTASSASAPPSNEDIPSYSSPPTPFLNLPLNHRTQTSVHSSISTRVYYSYSPNAEAQLKKSKAVKTSSKSMSSQPCRERDRRETRDTSKAKDESQPFLVVSAEDEIQRLEKELESVRSRLRSQQIQS
ncbi:hypothetical protein BKA69DRAFT_508921 [Paraphysoderma sedebokerense]|nr:hypothetical protein BKA69DRAFT_508921 [Paraphysoderma sedebokerense]